MVQSSLRVKHTEGTFQGTGGINLYEQVWKHLEPTRAVFVIVHGLQDYGGRYAEVANMLAEQKIAVYAIDLRGHGRSAGQRVWIDSFEDYLKDLDIFMKRIQEKEPDTPIFLFGHSMGGAIVTKYVLTRKPKLSGLVLSAPALSVKNVPGLLRSLTAFLGKSMPTFPAVRLNLNGFSRDKAVLAAKKADPLIVLSPVPARVGAELIATISYIQEHMEEITVPLLILHGKADKVTEPAGSKALKQRAGSKDKNLRLYDGLYHELFNEPEKDKVIGDLMKWLDAHIR